MPEGGGAERGDERSSPEAVVNDVADELAAKGGREARAEGGEASLDGFHDGAPRREKGPTSSGGGAIGSVPARSAAYCAVARRCFRRMSSKVTTTTAHAIAIAVIAIQGRALLASPVAVSVRPTSLAGAAGVARAASGPSAPDFSRASAAFASVTARCTALWTA